MKNNKRYIKGVLILVSCFLSLNTSSQTLQDYLKIAEKNNPRLKAADYNYKNALEKRGEVHTLPNTEIGVGYFVSEPETRTGAQRFKVSVKQMIPWFGSITVRENYRNSLAEVTFENLAIAKRKLIVAISLSYYNLVEIRAKQEVVKENIALLKTYEELALTSLKVGKASAVDVLRLQIRQNELEQLKKVLEQTYIGEQTLLNKLLNRKKETKITVVRNLEIPLNNSLKRNINLKVHPELIQYDKLYASVSQLEVLNQKESKPMLGFGLDYIAVSERSNMNFSDNGKDIIMPMLSLSIPIFNKKYTSKTKQNKFQQLEIKAQKQERLNALETAFNKAITKRTSAIISYETQIKNLGQAKNVEEILRKTYETGIIDFKEVLDIQELQLKIQINKIEAVKNYYIQTISINYLSN